MQRSVAKASTEQDKKWSKGALRRKKRHGEKTSVIVLIPWDATGYHTINRCAE